MATQPRAHQSRARYALNGDKLFVGLTTAIFIGLSLTAAWSVWSAFH